MNKFKSIPTRISSCLVQTVIATCMGTAVYAQVSAPMHSRIDKLASEIIDQKQAVGISILVIKEGKPVYNKAFGLADGEKKIPMRTDHIFRIASQTKAITSLAAMMLLEEGKFLLDDPVSKFIPEFKEVKVLDKFNAADSSYTTKAASREITIRDLMRHTSGISYAVFSGNPVINAIYTKAGVATGIGSKGNLKEKMALLARQPLVHQPGEAFTYGLNTDVLGYLVEIWGAVPLDEFFRKRVFEPLDMKDTYFQLPAEKKDRLVALSVRNKKSDLGNVHGLIYEGNTADYPLVGGIYRSGGAGLVSTTEDYAKFLSLLLNDGRIGGKRLIGTKTLDLMLSNQLPGETARPVALQFGLGVALVTPQNKFMHATSTDSFYWGGIFNTYYWVDPKEKLIGLVYTQTYDAYSENIGNLFKNVIYSTLGNE
jgi:CubicO group peptidase (beta-lactamase class C family)